MLTIRSTDEEKFVISMLPDSVYNGSQGAAYFWIDSANVARGIGLDTNLQRLSQSKRCPPAPKQSSCPAKVVHFATREPSIWCNVDCDKDHVNAICEISITRSKTNESKGPKSASILANDSRTDAPIATLVVTNSPSQLQMDSDRCGVGWLLYKSTCFKILMVRTKDGDGMCFFRLSAGLASITSSDQQRIIQSYVSSLRDPLDKPLLLDAGFDRETGRLRSRKTQEDLRYTNWAPNEPDTSPGNECIAMIANKYSNFFGKWISTSCESSGFPLCR